MINKSSVRGQNKKRYATCIKLRKAGLSYSEIRKEIPVAKSTLQNWLTLAGLTLTREHLEIQLKKSIEKRDAATEASKITRARKRKEEIDSAVLKYKKLFNDPRFIYGIALYEAEGSKKNNCKFSNSDWRLIKIFTEFIKTYFDNDAVQSVNFGYSLFVHESRKRDLERIKSFWSRKLNISKREFSVYWKRNKIVRKRKNKDYMGQIMVSVSGVKYLTSKLLAFSSIILSQQLKYS